MKIKVYSHSSKDIWLKQKTRKRLLFLIQWASNYINEMFALLWVIYYNENTNESIQRKFVNAFSTWRKKYFLFSVFP